MDNLQVIPPILLSQLFRMSTSSAKIWSFIVAAMLMWSCSSQRQNKEITEVPDAKDFVKVGSGPSGMEGPAVSKNGVLYFVNAGKNGNIGRVDLESGSLIF